MESYKDSTLIMQLLRDSNGGTAVQRTASRAANLACTRIAIPYRFSGGLPPRGRSLIIITHDIHVNEPRTSLCTPVFPGAGI